MEKLSSYFSLKVSGAYLLYCTLILLGKVNVLHSVEIRRLSVPRWVQNGTEDYVVLDCDYTYNENDFRLVVKWFFEDNLEPVYQWIPELDRRHISGVLVDRLDLNFAVNTADAYSRFRALKIPKPSTELSGKYTCQVSSLASQDSREQFMTVFVPANEFELSYRELGDSSVNVTCEALGLFPKPVLKLYLGSSNGSPPQVVSDVVTVSISKPSGAYDAYLYRTFSASELSKNGASVFECLLELPGTNYAKAKRIAYYPDYDLVRYKSRFPSQPSWCAGLHARPVFQRSMVRFPAKAFSHFSFLLLLKNTNDSTVVPELKREADDDFLSTEDLAIGWAGIPEVRGSIPGEGIQGQRIDAPHGLSSASHTVLLSWLPLAWNVKLVYILNLLRH